LKKFKWPRSKMLLDLMSQLSMSEFRIKNLE
jgi:hypothetical protein